MEKGVLQRISLHFGYEVQTLPDSKPVLVIYHLDLENGNKEPLAAINVDGIVINDYSRKSMFAVSWDEKTLLYMHDQAAMGPEALRNKESGLYRYVDGKGERMIHPEARLISHTTFQLPRNTIEFALGDPNEASTEHYTRTTEGIELLQEEMFVMQFGGTELHRAAAKGDTARAKQFLNSSIDLEATDNRGFTPLHVAIWNGQEEMAKLLINSGVNVNARMRGSLDWSPLEEAARFGLVDTIGLLLDHGADINSRTRSGGATALHMAVDYKKLKAAEVLITRGADVNAKTKDGTTPLHIFAQGARDERGSRWAGSPDEALLNLLLSRGADVAAKNDKAATPLHYAVLKNNIMTARALMEHGANADVMELPDRHSYGRVVHHEKSMMTLGQRIQEIVDSAWWQQGGIDNQ